MGDKGKLLKDTSTVAVLSNLLGRIVHDFNNPLAAIIGFADLLRNPDLPLEKRTRYVERVFEQASKMAQLVETMSHFSSSPSPTIGPVVLGRTRPPGCARCGREQVCGGHFEAYFARYGTAGLEPQP